MVMNYIMMKQNINLLKWNGILKMEVINNIIKFNKIMETINHENYVSVEIAKLLKKVGFNWEVKTYYHYLLQYDEYNLKFDIISTNYNHFTDTNFSAPTLSVAQRWLRENKDFDINIITDFDSVKKLYYIRYIVKDEYYKTYYITDNQSYVYFNTFEEAQEAGIKKALEIILKKGEQDYE